MGSRRFFVGIALSVLIVLAGRGAVPSGWAAVSQGAYNVVTVEECGLELKIGKTSLAGVPVRHQRSSKTRSLFFEATPLTSLIIFETLPAGSFVRDPQKIIVECYVKSDFFGEGGAAFLEEFDKGFTREKLNPDGVTLSALIGLGDSSAGLVETTRGYSAAARPMKHPNGRMVPVPIHHRIYVLTTHAHCFVFAFEGAEPIGGPLGSESRITLDTYIGKPWKLEKEDLSQEDVLPGRVGW